MNRPMATSAMRSRVSRFLRSRRLSSSAMDRWYLLWCHLKFVVTPKICQGCRMDHVIEARGLAKSFPGAEAVPPRDLTVEAGEIVGFLGRNGAATTTTLRMLTTLLHPAAGTATVAGRDVATGPAGGPGRI